jgi:hypothetical protein
MTLNYERASELFGNINVAGRWNHAWCTRDGWQATIERDFARHGQLYMQRTATRAPAGELPPSNRYMQAAAMHADRLRLTSKFLCANLPRAYRMTTYALRQTAEMVVDPVAAAPARPMGAMVLGAKLVLLWPLLEFCVGRGHLTNVRPEDYDDVPMAHDFSQADHWLHFGVLGTLVELPGLMWSQEFLRTGRPNYASLCLYGACAGRLALQPVRLLSTAACIAATLPLAFMLAVLAAGVDGLLALGHAVGRKLSPRIAQHPLVRQLVRSTRLAPDALFLSMFQAVHRDRALDNTLPANNVRASPKGDVSAQVRTFIRKEIMAFRYLEKFNGDAEAQAQAVVALRDQIMAALKDYCSELPDDSGYRWGLSQLNDFICLTYDEALCHREGQALAS